MTYFEILDKFKCFFQKKLLEKDSFIVRDYLKKRKINQLSIETFCIGYCPKVYNEIFNFMDENFIDYDKADYLGIYQRKENYFIFTGRLIFPIFDCYGRCVGFSGRDLTGHSKSKYVNSKASSIYSKRRTLYGLNLCKRIIYDKGIVFLVEGNLDVIKVYQNGINNVVASMGTAFTDEQAFMLKRYNVERAIIVFDDDEAGIKASEDAEKIFINRNIKPHIVKMKNKEDPDSFLDHYGVKEFKRYVKENMR